MTVRMLLCLLLTGCAADRYVSDEDDRAMRKACEEAGCVIIPAPLWEQVKRLLGVQEI